MIARLGRMFGSVVGVVFVASALVRALFDAYGHVGQFLGLLPPPAAKFVASANGTVFLVIVGLGILWWGVRHPPAAAAGPALSPSQRAAVQDVLARYPRPATFGEHDQYRYFIIFPVPGDARASEVAAELRGVFGEAGLDPQLISDELPGLRDFSRFRHGVWIRGTGNWDEGRYNPPTVQVLTECLRAAGIPFQRSSDDVAEIELIIGHPPKTPTDDAIAAAAASTYRSEVERLKAENAELRASLLTVAPRRLSREQAATMMTKLSELSHWYTSQGRTQPMIHVLHGSGTDCGDYARQFQEVFQAAGYRVVTHSPGTHEGDDFHYGLWVRWDRTHCDKYGWPYDGPVVADALQMAGVEATVLERDGTFLSLIVGSRYP